MGGIIFLICIPIAIAVGIPLFWRGQEAARSLGAFLLAGGVILGLIMVAVLLPGVALIAVGLGALALITVKASRASRWPSGHWRR